MSVSIDHTDAEEILLSAFTSRCKRTDVLAEKMKEIVTGSHKTYRYILLTGLLAKATNNNANPLALQAGSSLEGAYDARSLCHKVLIPFERNFLNNVLGGSNEPFLNKPARFKELSTTNAVRGGQDKDTLKSLISVFNAINSSEEAFDYLACILRLLEVRILQLDESTKANIKYKPTLIEIYNFILKFLRKSHEGECLVLVVATLEDLYFKSINGQYRVEPHKVNQSGSSSKEVGDIDIYYNEVLHYSIEVKDKSFNAYDVIHAFEKIKSQGGTKALLVYGQQISAVYDLTQILLKFEKEGFYTQLVDIRSYSRHMLFRIELDNHIDFVDTLFKMAKQINAKDDTLKWLLAILLELKWK